MSSFRYLTKRFLGQFGLELRRVPNLERSRTPTWLTDPVTAEYLPSYRGSLVVDAKIEDARGLHIAGFPFTDAHPFVRAAKAGLAATDSVAAQEAIHDVLAGFYAADYPANGLEAVGLDASEAPGLVGQPAYACLLPWSARDIDQTIKGRAIAMKEVGFQYGVSLSIKDGLTAFGPVTHPKLSLETARLYNLVQSVKRSGFTGFDARHPLKASALRCHGKTRWQVEEGHHRIPVAVAMGIIEVPIMVTQIVRRSDAGLWPRVQDGTFHASGATKIFDRIWGGQSR